MKEYSFVITAEEARETTKDYSKMQDEIELEEIFNKIAERIRQGSYWLTLHSISLSNRHFLEKYGYKVKPYNKDNAPLFVISWNKEN